MDTLGHSWTHTTARHQPDQVPWKILATSQSPNKHHTYGSIPTHSKASRWWTQRATGGSSAEQNYGGGAMSTAQLLLAVLVFLATTLVIALVANHDDDEGPFA